jgi:hypothetical protein
MAFCDCLIFGKVGKKCPLYYGNTSLFIPELPAAVVIPVILAVAAEGGGQQV